MMIGEAMPSKEDIARQYELLRIRRDNVHLYLQQHAQHGSAHVPPEVVHGLRENRVEIARIKRTLRRWRAEVDDHPDDGTSTPMQPLPLAPTEVPPDTLRPVKLTARDDAIQVGSAQNVTVTKSSKFPLGSILLVAVLLTILLLVMWYLGHIPPA
jgi:hypothetical protein